MSPTPEQIEAGALAFNRLNNRSRPHGPWTGTEIARAVLEAAASVPPLADEPIGWCVVSGVDRRWADHESSARALAERLNADPYNRHPYTVCALVAVPSSKEPTE